MGREAIVTFKMKETGHGIRGKPVDFFVTRGGLYWIGSSDIPVDSFHVACRCYFGEDQRAELAKMKDGIVTVRGQIVRWEFGSYKGRGRIFCIDLGHCVLIH
jgi:hypothetical protein